MAAASAVSISISLLHVQHRSRRFQLLTVGEAHDLNHQRFVSVSRYFHARKVGENLLEQREVVVGWWWWWWWCGSGGGGGVVVVVVVW